MAYVFMLITIGLALIFLMGELASRCIKTAFDWAVTKVNQHSEKIGR
jgi:hypothetical protein